MRTTRRRLAIGFASLVVLSACNSESSTRPAAEEDAARAVTVFTHLADSVSRTGGDADMGSAYASLAEAVRQGGRISTITIAVDGAPTTFYATAHQSDISITCPAQVCAAIARTATLRSLIAWQKDDPRRVVQLSSEANGDPIRAYLVPVLVPFAGNSASLTFFDGKGGVFFGTSGAQKFDVTKGAAPCAPTSERVTIAIYPAPPRCTQADFSIAFDGKTEPSSFLAGRNNATGSHTLSMSTQQVLGAHLALSAPLPPQPPIVVPPSASLPATLAARVDSVVNLTLTVSNPSASPIKVDYSSGQHFNFTIYDSTTGQALWVWSADKLFMQQLSSETIPANGKVEFTAQWKPTKSGSLVAHGTLVSLSHRADARVPLAVP